MTNNLLRIVIFLAIAAILPAQTPAAHTFHDPAWKLSFDYPANWTFTRSDGEISTFHLDARSAPSTTLMRAVAAVTENPFPASTFSGAYFYFSVTPHSTEASCTRQAGPPSSQSSKPGEPTQIAGIPFTHGHDQQKQICIVQRDEIYTTYRRGSCYRFDLDINNFCGGDVSHVKDIAPEELNQVRARLEAILATVRFDSR